MRAIDDGRLRLEDTVARWIPEWNGNDRGGGHDRGPARALIGPDRLPAFLTGISTGRIDFSRQSVGVPLEYAPRTRSIYSDLGFMLLGFILEDAQHRSDSFTGAPGASDPGRRLDAQFRRLATFLTPEPLGFSPPRKLARPHGADGGGSVARAAARR